MIGSTKFGVNELLAILVQQVKDLKVCTRRNLDELCKSIPDLSNRQGAEESKVQEGVDRSMVGTKAVLVVAVVDGNLDAHTSINQANDSSRHPNEVGVSSVGRAGETEGSSVKVLATIGCR